MVAGLEPKGIGVGIGFQFLVISQSLIGLGGNFKGLGTTTIRIAPAAVTVASNRCSTVDDIIVRMCSGSQCWILGFVIKSNQLVQQFSGLDNAIG